MTAAQIVETPPIRPCIACQQQDNHPRHVINVSSGVQVLWHMDCHALTTQCEICAQQIADAKGATGDRLREHLMGLTPQTFSYVTKVD